jgi:hypothetical protein
MVLGTHKANSQSLVLLLSARPPHWHWSFKLAALTWDRVNPVLVRMWEGRGRRYLAVTMWLLQFSKWDFYYSLRVTGGSSFNDGTTQTALDPLGRGAGSHPLRVQTMGGVR